MDEPTVLRTTKIGGGFVKEDVMTYLDELNSKIVGLEEELKAAKSGSGADPQEVQRYKNQIDSLQEKLNTSNNALRQAKKENEELQKTINQLKAGGGQGNPQQVAAMNQALEAAKKEIDTLKNQLRAAEQRAAAGAGSQQANAQANAALEAARKEIDGLRNQLKTAEQKASAPSANSGELDKARQDIQRINAELTAKSKEIADITAKLDAKTKELAEKDDKITKLTKEMESAIADKDAEISKLNDEITDLKENGTGIPSSFDMGALFTEAQKTANKITIEAQRNADKVTKDANEEAEKIVNDAKIEAETTIANANTTAETCIREANDQAKSTVDEANKKAQNAVDEANRQAKDTVDQANAHADKVNEMTATVRSMLLNEINSVNTKFDDISSVLKRLAGQATDRMSEAQLIIGEAKSALDKGEDDGMIKKAEAPVAKFEAKEAPTADIKAAASSAKSDSKDDFKGSDPFASIGEKTFNNNNSNNKSNFNNNNINNNNNNNKSSAPAEQKPVTQKKSSNFNFDMAELLKAAEEEAAKNPEEE